MKKPIAILCTAMLSASCFLTVGCGSNANNATTEAPKTEAAQPADPKEAFVGTWKLAAAESQGVVMSGDLSKFVGSDSFNITLNADGTGTSDIGGEKSEFTWTAESAEKATMTSNGETKDIACKDGALQFETTSNDQTITVIFTKDGTYAGAKTISVADAKPITSESELIGTWKITGLNIAGISAYGSADALAQMSNGADTTMTFKEGGDVESGGTTSKWSVTSEGAVLTSGDEDASIKMPIVKLGDDIAIDMSSVMKELLDTDMELIAVYSK